MRLAVLLFLAAALPRIVYLLVVGPAPESQYWALADSLIRTGTFTIDGLPITDFEPLYPLFLAGARLLAGPSVVAVQLVQIAFASLGAVLLFRLTLALTGSRRPALIAALLFAAYPLLIRHASSPSDSSLTTVLLLGFAAASPTGSSTGGVVAGLFLGLAALSRTAVLPVVAIMAAIHAWCGRPREAVIVATVAALVMFPWAIRNHLVNGSWWPTRSGINLYIGNSPYTAALLPDHDLDLLEQPAYELASLARPDIRPDSADYVPRIDAYLTSASIAHMIESPVVTVMQKLENVVYFLSPYLVPRYVTGPGTSVRLEPPDKAVVDGFVVRPRIEILSHGLAASFVLVAAAIGVYLRRRVLAVDAALWAIVFGFVLVHALYFPATRYRAPMEFVFFHYAAVALASLDVRTEWRRFGAGAK